MAGLKDMMTVQEIELILAGASRDMAKQGCQHLEAECQKLCSACGDKSSSTHNKQKWLGMNEVAPN
jgi:hypothetical protein